MLKLSKPCWNELAEAHLESRSGFEQIVWGQYASWTTKRRNLCSRRVESLISWSDNQHGQRCWAKLKGYEETSVLRDRYVRRPKCREPLANVVLSAALVWASYASDVLARQPYIIDQRLPSPKRNLHRSLGLDDFRLLWFCNRTHTTPWSPSSGDLRVCVPFIQVDDL